jgi:hypothetical protein
MLRQQGGQDAGEFMREIEPVDISSGQPDKSHDVEASTFPADSDSPKIIAKEEDCFGRRVAGSERDLGAGV